MKRTLLTLAVACAMMANLSPSLVNAPVIQAQAQSTATIGSVISTIISFITSFFTGDDDKGKGEEDGAYRMERPIGVQDCHDELIYYYKQVKKEDGTTEKQFVGSVNIKFGEMIEQPPTDYTEAKRQYYKENNNHERVECDGAKTASPCTPHFLTCQEQNP